MKKILILLLLSVFPLYFFAISGCESTTGLANGNGVIKGNIKDTTSLIPLDSVVITTTPATSTVMTNASGDYIISGVEDGTYTLTAKKPGYFTRTTTATVVDADTATANTRMRFTGVYSFNITIQEANSIYTNLSAVDLIRGIAINEVQLNDPNKDIQMRNSYDTLGNSVDFYLRSGDLAFQRAGSQTFFGQPLSINYTKAQFDTISAIPGFDGINYSAFFNQNATATFNVFPEGSNNVYPFWLSGRGNNPNIIGIIYLRKSYTGVGNLFYLDIDVKVNKLGYNLFNSNQ
jgi:hypothetical protein